MKKESPNTTELVDIHIKEENLHIFVKPGTDIEEIKKRYAERNIVRPRYVTAHSNVVDEAEVKLIDKE
jgi:hypothetical protein